MSLRPWDSHKQGRGVRIWLMAKGVRFPPAPQ
nr:MAG TPA: hypothetical protein [Caudoviricetes sp.]